MMRRRATVTQKAWLETSLSSGVISLMPTTSCTRTSAISVCATSGMLDCPRDQAGHFLRARFGDRFLGDLAAAAKHRHAVGNGEDVGHAVADENDGNALVAEAPDQ